jgi:O-antigen/teichoic acid export membrane protein
MHRQPGRGHRPQQPFMLRLKPDLRGLVHIGKMSAGYFVTTFVNNAIPFLVLPILTRYLAPEQFANVALFSFYLVLSNTLSGITITTVIDKHFFDSDKKHMAAIIGNSLFIVMAFSLATELLILVTYPLLRSYFNLSLFWLILIPVTSFAFIVFSMGLTVLRNEKKGMLFGRHQIGNTAINITLSVALIAVFLYGWQGRVWGIIISYLFSALMMYRYLHANGFISFSLSRKTVKGILHTIMPLIPNSIQSIIISQVGIFFIQLYFSKQVLGLYAVGFQVAFAVKLLNSALELSWSPYVYEQLAKKNPIDRMYLARLFLALIAVMFIGGAAIIVFAKLILKIMTNADYLGANKFIPWFTMGYFFHGLSVFLGPFLIKFEKQRYISMVSFVNMIMMIVLSVWFVKVFGYIGVAYAFSTIYFLMFLAFAWKAQKAFPLPWLRAIRGWS